MLKRRLLEMYVVIQANVHLSHPELTLTITYVGCERKQFRSN